MNYAARENTHKDSQASLTTLNVKVIEKCLILLQKITHNENHWRIEGGALASPPPPKIG